MVTGSTKVRKTARFKADTYEPWTNRLPVKSYNSMHRMHIEVSPFRWERMVTLVAGECSFVRSLSGVLVHCLFCQMKNIYGKKKKKKKGKNTKREKRWGKKEKKSIRFERKLSTIHSCSLLFLCRFLWDKEEQRGKSSRRFYSRE